MRQRVVMCERQCATAVLCPLGGAHLFSCSHVCHVTEQSTLIGSEKRRSYWGGQAGMGGSSRGRRGHSRATD